MPTTFIIHFRPKRVSQDGKCRQAAQEGKAEALKSAQWRPLVEGHYVAMQTCWSHEFQQLYTV